MLSKKLIITVLAVTIASGSALHASPAPQYTNYKPTRWENFARKVGAGMKYIPHASASLGIVAGALYYGTQDNKSLENAAKMALSVAMNTALVSTIVSFLIAESID